jgi:protein kinase-like protein
VTLAAGARLGPYEIVSALGAGGMGEVYRARDARLNRDVALKVLPEAFILDPDRLARFKREAQVLASLNHPNIAAIYGFEDSSPSPGSGQAAVQALVLELVEGPTLADRIAQGTIPLDEALPIARQIAEALEAAHEQGIIHRDLKPANIKLRPDGTVKVLDFGLAKALEPVAVKGEDETASPTITSPAMTQMGIILGTAAYMSPEQAKGRQADKRSDVWAFGAVLYEMLSGQRAFKGDDISDTLAAVLRQDIDWTALPPSMPASVRRLIARCLDRDARRRLRDIGEARIVLEDPVGPARGDAGGVPALAPPRPLWRRATPIATAPTRRRAPCGGQRLAADPARSAFGRAHDSHDVRVNCVSAVGHRSRRRHHTRRFTHRLSRHQPATGACAEPARAHGAGRSSRATRRIRLTGRTVGWVCRRKHAEESGDHGRDPSHDRFHGRHRVARRHVGTGRDHHLRDTGHRPVARVGCGGRFHRAHKARSRARGT